METKVNRHETEEKLLDLLEEIIDVYHEYNPDGKYLSMFFSVVNGDPYVSVSNAYWHGGEDENAVITASRSFGEEDAV